MYLLFLASVHGFMHETSDFVLLYNNLFIYQVLCTLIYRRRSLYSFLLNGEFRVNVTCSSHIDTHDILPFTWTFSHFLSVLFAAILMFNFQTPFFAGYSWYSSANSCQFDFFRFIYTYTCYIFILSQMIWEFVLRPPLCFWIRGYI